MNKHLAAAAFALLLAAGCVAHTQSVPRSAVFEVASIKPSDPTETMAIQRSGNRFTASNFSLQQLITWAYGIHSDRLYNAPGWLDSTRYDIVARFEAEDVPDRRIPGEPTPLQHRMQALLAERFRLVIHRESRERSIYALVVAKGGPKVHPVESSEPAGQAPFNMPGAGRLTGTRVTTAMLSVVLSSQLDRTVQDQTGLKGVFDFSLLWKPDTPAGMNEEDSAADDNVSYRASIFTAVQEQLGLKLEGRKGKVEIFVIDHIERKPTQN